MTEDECKKVMDAVVAAHVERNPDLWNEVLKEIYLYGGVTPETSMKIMDTMDAEARS